MWLTGFAVLRWHSTGSGELVIGDAAQRAAVVLERVDWRTRRDVIDLSADVGLAHGGQPWAG